MCRVRLGRCLGADGSQPSGTAALAAAFGLKRPAAAAESDYPPNVSVTEAAATKARLGRPGERLRLGVIGCGDVSRRHYLPALAALADRVEIRACVDPQRSAAVAAAARVADWSPSARPYADLSDAVANEELDAVVNITPAPAHAAVSLVCLRAGLHVYSEKPIAGSLADADRLIDTAAERGLHLLCAPGVAVTDRFRWLAEIVASDRLGRLTLAVAHHADTGPATWREYSGDPSVFYRPGVGPVFDHGVYRLHAMTLLLGPVARVQAMGTIALPSRVVRAGPLAGRTIAVTTSDHVLMNLEFAGGGLGQLLTSFAAPATLAPWLELHFANGTISFGGESSDEDGTASMFVDDDSPLGLEGWVHGLRPPPPGVAMGVVEAGVAHFIACVRGDAKAVLTAEHARHVLDIILKGYASIDDGQSHETVTTFDRPGTT
jgi:predicted dehydrogenase